MSANNTHSDNNQPHQPPARVSEPPVYQPPQESTQQPRESISSQAEPATDNSPANTTQASSPPEQEQDQSQQQYAHAAHQQYVTGQVQHTQLKVAEGQETQQKVVWMARPHMPEAPDIPEEALRRHDESVKLYPDLNLSRGEFIISAVRRHPIGLISIWLVSALVVVLSLGILGFFFANQGTFLAVFDGGSSTAVMAVFTAVFLLMAAMGVLGGFIATYVYQQNKFFLTNESVVQCIQISIFSRKEQTVSLGNIEDASYRKHGIVQHIFNYGNIRLSTAGDETTYRFSYVKHPKHQIALLNNAVEAFKMGRPVMHLDK